MAYIDENTRWRFTAPQAGEVDSAQSVAERLEEVDKALIGPMNRAELLSGGAKLNPATFVDGDSSKYSDAPDEYWSTIEGRPVYTTKTHFHPMPTMVMRSNTADSASYAEGAEHADEAAKLSPGFKLNGKTVTGEGGQEVVLGVDDISDAPRVFWGTSAPSSPPVQSPRKGDIYVQVL